MRCKAPCIKFRETSDSVIDNNKFLGGHGNAISVYDRSPRSQIENNQISNYDRMAIEVWNGGDGALVEDNAVKLNCAGVRSWGISMDRSPNSVVKGNQVICSGNNGFNGIEIVGSDNSQVTGNTISGFGTGMSIDPRFQCQDYRKYDHFISYRTVGQRNHCGFVRCRSAYSRNRSKNNNNRYR